MNQDKLCRLFGRTRQGYRKCLKLHDFREHQSEKIHEIVCTIRAHQPMAGVRKMHAYINHDLLFSGIEPIGRDRLFEVLREKRLLVPRRRRSCRTTDSYHRYRTHKNLLKNVIPTGPNQAWVADITYLRLVHGFSYLFLLTDYYSRKIVGYYLGQNLGMEGALKALSMALRQAKSACGIIHHSDRGIQYCCDAYAKLQRKHKMIVSMTEVNHCYENAVAERVNETLKYDLKLGGTFLSHNDALKATKEAIKIYNNERWHQALNYLTPAMKHAA